MLRKYLKAPRPPVQNRNGSIASEEDHQDRNRGSDFDSDTDPDTDSDTDGDSDSDTDGDSDSDC